MRLVPVLAVVSALLITPAAQAGAPIRKVATCTDSYVVYSPKTITRFRGAVLCLVNAVRKTQHLPALKRDSRLESVAQAQSKGNGGHGKSLAEIGKRFEKKGYHPAAYNEAYSFLDQPALPTPYAFIAQSMAERQVPCSEILDPRFRDIGVGISSGSAGPFATLALEFGLKRGAKQPSNDYTKAASCPHKIPAPLFTKAPIGVTDALPTAKDDHVTLGLTCEAKAQCVLDHVVLTLKHVGTTSQLEAPLTIPAGGTANLTFQFDPAKIQSELASDFPSITLAFDVTKPLEYSDTFPGPLKAG